MTWNKLSEIRQSEKATHHTMPTVLNSGKGKTMESGKRLSDCQWSERREI